MGTGGGIDLGNNNQPNVGHVELKESVGKAGDIQEAIGHQTISSGVMRDLEAEDQTLVAW